MTALVAPVGQASIDGCDEHGPSGLRRRAGRPQRSCHTAPMVATTNRLIFNPLTYRLVINPSIYNLLFTSFASKRFAAQTRLVSADDWLFLNFCYDDPSMGLTLDESDEPNRYSIQLYHRTATQVDLTDKKVLEVSCGHGGGASYLVRTSASRLLHRARLEPRRRRLLPRDGTAGRAWISSRATPRTCRSPTSPSTRCSMSRPRTLYPHFPRFLAEVARVLTPGGHFLYADFRGVATSPTGMRRWRTPRCGWFRTPSSTSRFCAGWREVGRSQARSDQSACVVSPLRPVSPVCQARRSTAQLRTGADLLPDVLVHQGLRRSRRQAIA